MKERQTRGWQTLAPWLSLFYSCYFKVRELRRLLHFSNVVRIKLKKKKKDLGLRGLYPAKPKIFTIWYFRVKNVASTFLLHQWNDGVNRKKYLVPMVGNLQLLKLQSCLDYSMISTLNNSLLFKKFFAVVHCPVINCVWCSKTLWIASYHASLLEKAMAPHSGTLAWKIPWTQKPGRLQPMESWRVRHDWATSLPLFTFMHWRRKWQPTPVFLPGESQGWGSLVGCHLWGHTELDTTEAI